MFIRILQDLQIRTQKINYSNDTAQQVVKEAV